MTSEEKRAKRMARHQVQKALKNVCPNLRLCATNPQLKQATKVLTDRYYKEQVRPAAERIEANLLAALSTTHSTAEAQTSDQL